MNTSILALAGLALLSTAASAQIPAEPPPRTSSADLPLDSNLYRAWTARDLPLEELRDHVVRGFIDIDDARRVHVEIVGPRGGTAVSDALVERFGGVPNVRWKNRLDARVPIQRLVDLARVLPPGHRVRRAARPTLLDVTGEGPAVTGSSFWRNGGANGAGRKVAVIDADFGGLAAAVANGDLGAWTGINYTGTTFQGPVVHGTACAETVYDHAPGAQYFLYKVASPAQLGSAVDDCISRGVDVISHSLGWDGDFWFDDEGAAADAARDAADAGILFFTSAGNSAQQHWQGTFSSAGGTSWHAWTGSDATNRIEILPNETATITLTWDDSWSGTDDYDLYLYNDAGTTVLTSSTASNEFFEAVAWTNPSMTSSLFVQLAVWRDDGPGAEFEVFNDGDGVWEYFVTQSSTSSPSNSTHPHVISVGAVPWGSWSSAPGTGGIVTSYSSQGPTNGGYGRPTLVAPTATTTFSYGGAFNGTSCSAPNAAGVALCLWSSIPGYDESAIRWLLARHASAFKDWGSGGFDHVYGHGGTFMIDFAPNTRWLTNEYANSGGSASFPANTLPHALNQTPDGGRIVAFPGGDYPAAPQVLSSPVTIVSRGAAADFGD